MTERFSDVAQNIQRVREEIARAAHLCGRDPNEISLMAVTKGHSAQRINDAIASGIRLLGENRAQELAARYADYRLAPQCEVQFIGHLQSNKVRQVIDKVSMVQSLDRVSLARELNRCAEAAGRAMPVLVEVNVGREPGKSGVDPARLEDFLYGLGGFAFLRVRGLMTIPPNDGRQSVREGYFMQMHRLFLDIRSKKIDNVNMVILSMGMSNDYPLAIRHGSTIVRIGRAIFGERL